jgi:hypothetical protein
MNVLPIADCRLPIGKLFARRCLTRGGHYGRKLVCFRKEGGELACGHRARFNKQFEPQCSFVSLFLNGSNFGNKFGLAAGAAAGAIIRRHRSTTANDLFGDNTPGIIGFGDCACELDDSQRKCFRAGFKFSWIHGENLQTKSAIGNRQSAIQE